MGHAGFKISFADPIDKDQVRNVYVDVWLGNPKIPDDLKDAVPDDADLILVTHGHFDHAVSAPDLLKASKKPDCKIVCNYEIG